MMHNMLNDNLSIDLIAKYANIITSEVERIAKSEL